MILDLKENVRKSHCPSVTPVIFMEEMQMSVLLSYYPLRSYAACNMENSATLIPLLNYYPLHQYTSSIRLEDKNTIGFVYLFL